MGWLNDNYLVVADFFIKSSYRDAKGEERPCYRVTENARVICEQYGIQLSPNFVKVPEYQQLQLFDFMNCGKGTDNKE